MTWPDRKPRYIVHKATTTCVLDRAYNHKLIREYLNDPRKANTPYLYCAELNRNDKNRRHRGHMT